MNNGDASRTITALSLDLHLGNQCLVNISTEQGALSPPLASASRHESRQPGRRCLPRLPRTMRSTSCSRASSRFPGPDCYPIVSRFGLEQHPEPPSIVRHRSAYAAASLMIVSRASPARASRTGRRPLFLFGGIHRDRQPRSRIEQLPSFFARSTATSIAQSRSGAVVGDQGSGPYASLNASMTERDNLAE